MDLSAHKDMMFNATSVKVMFLQVDLRLSNRQIFDSQLPSLGACTVTDIGADPANAEHVRWALDHRLSTGEVSDLNVTAFRPLASLTRESTAGYLHALGGLPYVGGPFSDLTWTNPYKQAILWMYNTGISTGFDLGGGARVYNPTGTVTRAVMAAFLYRFAHNLVPNVGDYDGMRATFADVPSSTAHATAIRWIGALGVAGPTGSSVKFRPGDVITRGEAAAFAHRFHDNVMYGG